MSNSAAPPPRPASSSVYFTDVFDVSTETLERYGAFNISLINDLPLFIDPFLLFNSAKPEYEALHDDIIAYLRFLRDKSVGGKVTAGELEAWFMFREVKQTWLGYSLAGNGGTGLGPGFAIALNRNLERLFTDFGSETVTHGSHLERLCLIDNGVGRDNISDFTTNLIKTYLLEYTQAFVQQHLRSDQRKRVAVAKARFDYQREAWATESYELPFHERDYVLLVPTDLLTKDDIWINRVDLVRQFPEIANTIGDLQLRAQINSYFLRCLDDIHRRDEEAKRQSRSEAAESRARKRRRESPDEPTKKQQDEAVLDALQRFPEFLDYYIRYKEDHGDEAEALADERVRSSERLYILQTRELMDLLVMAGFYAVSGNTREEARARAQHMKDVIENKGGHRLFYADGVPIRREADLHIIYRFCWNNSPSSIDQEVNNGRGPVDFQASRGRLDKTLIEFKLASNSKLRQNLEYQAEVYQKASDAEHALKVIVYFSADERAKVEAILKDLGLDASADVLLIDARDDNKPSGSTANAKTLKLGS
jgi:hypothetical protein